MLTLCWRTLTLSCPMLTLCWPKLPLSCPYVDPMFTLCSPMLAFEMLSPIAATETAEVGTGWERGWNGVTTGGSAVGAARLYNLRLLPKASGKDTGWPSWPVISAELQLPDDRGVQSGKRPRRVSCDSRVTTPVLPGLQRLLRQSVGDRPTTTPPRARGLGLRASQQHPPKGGG